VFGALPTAVVFTNLMNNPLVRPDQFDLMFMLLLKPWLYVLSVHPGVCMLQLKQNFGL
jgi:hypothetical protein